MLQKVIDFKVVQGESFQTLEAAVRSSIADGWVPSGPMVVLKSDVGQAMVKFADA